MLSYISYRILVQHCEQYNEQGKDIEWHINSKYSTEMAAKSNVVSNVFSPISANTVYMNHLIL